MRLGAFFLGWLCAKPVVNQAATLSVLCSFTTGVASQLSAHILKTKRFKLPRYFFPSGPIFRHAVFPHS